MKAFIDTSAWYAAADTADAGNPRAKELLGGLDRLITTDHVLLETWVLLRHRIRRTAAESFWDSLRSGVAHIETVTAGDLEAAWAIGREFADQDFSLADRTSFAVMLRLGVLTAVSFDDDFAIFRFGPGRRSSFDVLR
jgi:predicted nucleic acid-binding protein